MQDNHNAKEVEECEKKHKKVTSVNSTRKEHEDYIPTAYPISCKNFFRLKRVSEEPRKAINTFEEFENLYERTTQKYITIEEEKYIARGL